MRLQYCPFCSLHCSRFAAVCEPETAAVAEKDVGWVGGWRMMSGETAKEF